MVDDVAEVVHVEISAIHVCKQRTAPRRVLARLRRKDTSKAFGKLRTIVFEVAVVTKIYGVGAALLHLVVIDSFVLCVFNVVEEGIDLPVTFEPDEFRFALIDWGEDCALVLAAWSASIIIHEKVLA